jgi:polysaccharide biosynthesis protein PslG
MTGLARHAAPLRPLALVAAVLALALVFASPSGAGNEKDPKYSDKRLAKWLKNELRAQGLEPQGVSSCRPKRGKKVMVCKWRAKGVFPGEIPYECSGKARFTVKKKRWAIDPCNNIEEPRIPLKDAVGSHPLFGFNEDWVHELARLDQLAGTGANVARTGLYWDAVQPTSSNARAWTLFDGLYQSMLARGIRPLFILYAAPCWAQAGSCRQGAHPSAGHYDELADFAARAAQRYPQAAGIEVWNEPNYEIYWGGTPDPEAYGEMLKTVVPAIKAANPNMPVITAGLSPHINDDVDAMAYETFLRRAYATGGPQLADAIGTHPYPNRRYVEDYLGNIRVNLFRYLRVMKDFGEEHKPMWVTETGVSNDGDEGFSPDQQADALAQIYNLMRRIDHDIPVVVFHRFIDQPGDPRVKERGYGVVAGNGQPKPAYCAVAAVRDHPC